MRVYTAHVRVPVRDSERDIVFVREGFNGWAALFTTLWALVSRLWWVALGLLAAEAVLSLALDAAGVGEPASIVVSVGFALIVGFLANDLRRWTLFRRGFAEIGVVAAPSEDGATQRFFDLHPHLRGGLLR